MLAWTPLDLLPGLYALALGALLAAALRRWYDAVPWRVLALFAVVVAALYGRALFGGATLLAVDNLRGAPPFEQLAPAEPAGNHLQGEQVLSLAPSRAAVRRAVGAGELPLWNPLAGPGKPLLADPEAQAGQPLVALGWPLPLERAAGVTAALRVLVALIFGYLLLVRLGLGTWPAAAGALAFALGGFLQLWLGWPRADAAALAPALLYAVDRAVAPGRRRDLALLVTLAAAVLLAGDRAATAWVLAAALGFLLTRLRRLPPPARAAPFLRQAAAALLAAALAAPVLLPAAALAPRTPRAQALEARAAGALRDDLLGTATLLDGERRAAAFAGVRQRLVAVLAPGAFGNSRWGAYWGPLNVNEDGAAFAGTATLLLVAVAAVAALAGYRRRRATGPSPVEQGAAAGGAGAGPARPAARSRGEPSPREDRPPQPLPGEGWWSGFFWIAAAICLLVIARPPGIEQLLDHLPLLGRSPVFHQRGASLLLDLCLAVLAAAGLERLAAVADRRRRLRLLAPAVAVLALALLWAYAAHPPPGEPLAALRLRPLAVQLAALAAVALLALAPRRRALPAVVLVVAAELLLLHGPANPSLPRRLYYPQVPSLAFVQHAAADEGAGYRAAALGPVLLPEIAGVYGIADARARLGGLPRQVPELLAPVADPAGGESLLLATGDHPLLDLLGVRWLLTAPGVEPGDGLERLYAGTDAWVWHRPRALPRLFLPTSAAVFAGGDWAAQVAAIPDFAATALVQPAPGHRAAWTAPPGSAGSVELGPLAAARVGAWVELGGERLLATSIFQDGGWHLLVDGESRPLVVADGPLAAAWLPAGRHRVELLYRPPELLAGMVLAALAAAAALAWLLAPGPPAIVRTDREPLR